MLNTLGTCVGGKWFSIIVYNYEFVFTSMVLLFSRYLHVGCCFVLGNSQVMTEDFLAA